MWLIKGGGEVWGNGGLGEWWIGGVGGAGGSRGEQGGEGRRTGGGKWGGGNGEGDGDRKIILTPSLLSLFLTVVHIYPEQTPTLTLLYNRIKYHMQATI